MMIPQPTHGSFGEIIIVALTFFLICMSALRAKNKRKPQKKPTPSPAAPQMQTTGQLRKNPKPTAMTSDRHMSSLHESFKNLEDRNNDWLANQLKEEKALEGKLSAMYYLKKNHEANCDAKKIRDVHRRNCDAEGIDRGSIS